jgi:acyl-CoA synthetase (AMP-forming)/AMP-acid ligase II
MPGRADDIYTEVSSIGDLLLKAAALNPERVAVVMPDARIEYRPLKDRAIRFAGGLLELGVRRGDHIGLFVPNSIEYIEAFFAITLLGCVVVPINVRHKASEIGYIVANADLVALVTSGLDTSYVDLPSVLHDALPSLAASDSDLARLDLLEAPKLRHVINMGGPAKRGMFPAEQLPAADLEKVEAARRRVRVRDNALILYTSGTTASPKGCVLSHEAVTRGPVERARYRLKDDALDVTWAAGPLFHIGSLAPFIGSVGVAGTFLTDRFFDPGRAVRLMAEEGVTLAWPWFSAIVQGIVDHPNFDPKKFGRLKHLFLIAPEALVDRVQDLLPRTEILQACGMTETAGVFALSDPTDDRWTRSNLQGRAAPGVELRIIDTDTGADAPDGTMGEIWVRGFCVTEGYYGYPEQTAAALTSDGWLRTGDLYTRHANGNVLFGGRLKDMLKVGGENVATMEVEAFLCSHPDVKLAEVVGLPDPRLDEVPVAFVELRAESAATPEDIIAFCRNRISSYKVPRRVIVLAADEWPMSATKVDKRALRERLRLAGSLVT